jgi:hypothetical protein
LSLRTMDELERSPWHAVQSRRSGRTLLGKIATPDIARSAPDACGSRWPAMG